MWESPKLVIKVIAVQHFTYEMADAFDVRSKMI